GRMWELFHPGSPWGPVHLNQKIALDFIEGREIIASRIALAQYYVLAPLAIGGAVILWRRRVTIAPFVALPIIATFAGVIAFGNARYRVPAEIAIVGLSAVAIDAILGALQRRWGRGGPPDAEPQPEEPRELVGVSNPTS